jgi:hypothetical protein
MTAPSIPSQSPIVAHPWRTQETAWAVEPLTSFNGARRRDARRADMERALRPLFEAGESIRLDAVARNPQHTTLEPGDEYWRVAQSIISEYAFSGRVTSRVRARSAARCCCSITPARSEGPRGARAACDSGRIAGFEGVHLGNTTSRALIGLERAFTVDVAVGFAVALREIGCRAIDPGHALAFAGSRYVTPRWWSASNRSRERRIALAGRGPFEGDALRLVAALFVAATGDEPQDNPQVPIPSAHPSPQWNRGTSRTCEPLVRGPRATAMRCGRRGCYIP